MLFNKKRGHRPLLPLRVFLKVRQPEVDIKTVLIFCKGTVFMLTTSWFQKNRSIFDQLERLESVSCKNPNHVNTNRNIGNYKLMLLFSNQVFS